MATDSAAEILPRLMALERDREQVIQYNIIQYNTEHIKCGETLKKPESLLQMQTTSLHMFLLDIHLMATRKRETKGYLEKKKMEMTAQG